MRSDHDLLAENVGFFTIPAQKPAIDGPSRRLVPSQALVYAAGMGFFAAPVARAREASAADPQRSRAEERAQRVLSKPRQRAFALTWQGRIFNCPTRPRG